MKNEIIIYQSDQLSTSLEVFIEDETIWLNQSQIIVLFDSSKANISEHIKHIFKSEELSERATVRNFRTVRKEGKRIVSRDIMYYNLDMIISIGYRVNSIRGTQFRIWASQVLKDYLLRGYSIHQRLRSIEDDVQQLTKKVDHFNMQVKSKLTPEEGIFFNGQIFDAYIFISDLIKSVKTSIILIDNYIDETIFKILAKRSNGVAATIYTTNLTTALKLDLKKHNQQYPKIEIKKFTKSHDRFLILDDTIVYHIGASLKDLGKKWFAFSRIEFDAQELLSKLNED